MTNGRDRNRKGRDWERELPRDKPDGHLPHSADAEASILGGIILQNDALALIDTLEVEDFYDHKNKVVFQEIRNLEAAGKPIDIVLLENEIAKTGKLDAIGGVAYLGELTLRVPTVDNIVAYAEIVREKHITRQVMVLISEVLAEAKHDGIEGEQLVHDVTVALLSVGTGRERKIYTMAELVAAEAARVNADIEARKSGAPVYAGVPTGIAKIDEKIGGHPRSIPTVYIARPGNGKTTMAMHLAKASRLANEESLLATYEDGPDSFGQRGLAQEGHLSTEAIRARRLKEDDIEDVAAAVLAAQARTECVFPAAGTTVEALVRRVKRENLIRRHRGKKPFGQLIVDYVQRIPQPEHARSRDEGITHIMSVIGAFAQEETIALVLMAQLNREVEKRDDHRPRLSDIRDSGSVENDGKLIFGLYRPWKYEPDKKDKATGKLLHAPEDLILVCLKNHQGEDQFETLVWWDLRSHAIYNQQIDQGAARNAVRTAHEQTEIGGGEFAQRFDDANDWHMRR